MKLLIDANVILDVLQAREPHLQYSALVWKLCETGVVEGVVSALSFANIVYVMRNRLTPQTVEAVLKQLSLIFTFADLKQSDLSKAASLQWKDYEDGIQYAIAGRIGADAIITRNTDDYPATSLPILTPAEFIAQYHS